MNDVVNKHRNKPKDIITVPKREIFIVLPYLGEVKLSLNSLNHVFTSSMVVLNKIIFRKTCRIKSFFPLLRQTQLLP